MKKYKVAIYHDGWQLEELTTTYHSSEEALRVALSKRMIINDVFAIIIYRQKNYLNHFQVEAGESILEFFRSIGYCFISIEDNPPIALSIDGMPQDEMSLSLPRYEGFELLDAKIVLLYTGELGREEIYTLTLHEAGHAITDMKYKLSYDVYTVFHEYHAWKWAKKQANIIELNNVVFTRLLRECLSTYVRCAMNKKGFIRGCGMSQKVFIRKYREMTRLDLNCFDLR